MRCYHFGNFYLSSIQQGIQSAHAQMELFIKYRDMTSDDFLNHSERSEMSDHVASYIAYTKKTKLLFDWAEHHKTMICLNGGMSGDLETLTEFLHTRDNPYPWSEFREEEFALNNTMTNVAIVLPENIYNAAASVRSRDCELLFNIGDNEESMSIYNNDTFNLYTLSMWEYELVKRLNQCGMAS